MRQFLHAVDNTKIHDTETRIINNIYKVNHVLKRVKDNCAKLEPERNQSIDGQIIPAKTHRSGIRQYNLEKM